MSSKVERNTNTRDMPRTSVVCRDTGETPAREQFPYTTPQLRRQDYYSGPAAELTDEEARAFLVELLAMFGADHDYYAPLPPLGLPGIAKDKMDPYGIEWQIITIGLRYLGAAARNEGRAMHHRWREAGNLARELEANGEAKEWVKNMRQESRQPKPKQMVYFIGAQSGPIKIGMAVSPRQRLYGLQTSHHERLELLATRDGGAYQERLYHRQFAGHRLNGEWFKRVPEIEAEIARLTERAITA